MVELGLLLALLSPADQTKLRWCRGLAQTVLLHAEGKVPKTSAHQVCEVLIERQDSIYIDDAELDDCFDLLRHCTPANAKLQR